MSTGPWESGAGLEIWGSRVGILAKNQPNRLLNKQMATSAREASITAFAGDLPAVWFCRKILPKIVPKCTAFSQSRNEALNYVENTMYFETSGLKIHFLMIRNIEITIKYPYGHLYYGQYR